LSDRVAILSYIGNQPYITRRKEMKTATATRIWTDLDGQCACDKHLGMEAMSRLKARPEAKTITTSMTKWSIMKQDEVDYLSNKYCDGGTICESCKGGM
tara:strand:+ start:102 stop:398 length:297 start_codon:yes stop_codon:yes gene_type:complete